jgi:hypothetical protein
MGTRRSLTLIAASLLAASAQAAAHKCAQHSVGSAVATALRQDAGNAARRTAERKLLEHDSALVPRAALGSVWSAVTDRLHRRRKRPAAPTAATPSPDCP